MENVAALGFLAKLSEDEQIALKLFIDQRMEESFKNNALLQRLAALSVRSELINETLAAITEKTGGDPEDVMVSALTFYDVAVDAVQEGMRVLIVNKDYGFVREVKGLLPKALDFSAKEKVAG